MKNQYEDYIEYQARIIILKLSKLIESSFIQIRYMLNDLSSKLLSKKSVSFLKLGTYYPLGILFSLLGIYLLLSATDLFSPDYVVYFFLTVFFSGIYLLRN